MDRRKILFADDDPEIREVVRILLESEGYQGKGHDTAVPCL